MCWAIAFLLVIPFAAAGDPNSDDDDWLGLVWLLLAFVVSCAYYVLTMRRKGVHNGQTWGKQVAGIRVVRDDGQPVGVETTLLREVLLKFIAGGITGIGWLIDGLWPLGERESRALHDFPASTHVVTTRAQAAAPPPPRPPAPRRQLAPGIQQHLNAAYAAANRIREAIQRAQLPYAQVSSEVDSLLSVMGRSADRAQMLHEALAEKPVAVVEARMARSSGRQDRAGQRARRAARGPAPPRHPARRLPRRDGAHRHRARDDPLEPAQRLCVDRLSACRNSSPRRSRRCATRWHPSRRA